MKLSAYLIAANKLRTTRITSIETESPTVKIFTFKDETCAEAKPGQFLMLWVPKVDEIPLSILDVEDDGTVSVAVKEVGDATRALHKMKVGEVIGVRGPFGNSFALRKGKILMVGGGTGVVPLLFVAKKLSSKASKLTFVFGAKTKEELILIDRVNKICESKSIIVTTEDGSYGLKSLATTPLDSLLAKEKFDAVYACGPEAMLRKVFDLTEKYRIALQVSLERLMRCAIGLCGSCVIGKYRVCRDGPVFATEQLRSVKSEFGVSRMDFTGKRVPLE